MHTYKLLTIILVAALVSAGTSSCSCEHPEFIHLDFADAVNIVGPSMGEKASGHFKIDTSIQSCDVYFMVNQRNPKCYAEPVIEKFIDTNQFIRETIAKRYYELTVHFYHRGANKAIIRGGDNTDELLRTRNSKLLELFNDDIISEYVWRNGRPADTLFYDDHGQIKGAEEIKLEDMRSKD